MQNTPALALVAVWSALGVCGCGPELPDTVPVTGTILFKGEPVAQAQVGFVPKTEGAGALPARGQTDAAGRFVLTTYVGPGQEAAGVTPGDYAVTVQKTDIPADPAKMAEMFSKNPGYVPPQLLPGRYATAAKSDLTATVTEDGENAFEFELVEETPVARRR